MYDGSRPLDPPGWWIRLFDGRGASTGGQEADVVHAIDGTEADGAEAEAAARARVARAAMPAAPEVPATG